MNIYWLHKVNTHETRFSIVKQYTQIGMSHKMGDTSKKLHGNNSKKLHKLYKIINQCWFFIFNSIQNNIPSFLNKIHIDKLGKRGFHFFPGDLFMKFSWVFFWHFFLILGGSFLQRFSFSYEGLWPTQTSILSSL